jgi:transcriptional regulator with XRE-family HTH domain
MDRHNIPELLTASEVAGALRVSASTLARWRCEGRGPAFVKLPKCVSYTRQGVADYILRSTVNTSDTTNGRPQ